MNLNLGIGKLFLERLFLLFHFLLLSSFLVVVRLQFSQPLLATGKCSVSTSLNVARQRQREREREREKIAYIKWRNDISFTMGRKVFLRI